MDFDLKYFQFHIVPKGADLNPSQNWIEIAALLNALLPDFYTDLHRKRMIQIYDYNPQNNSHDNNTSKLALGATTLTWRQLWAYVKNVVPPLLRDIPFYLNCKSKWWFPLRLPLSIYMCLSSFPTSEREPWIGLRIWIRLFYRKNTAPPRGYMKTMELAQWYYQKKEINDTVIEWHKYALSSDLLNALRVHRLQMKWTAKALDFLTGYFYQNPTERIVAHGRTYPVIRTTFNFFCWIYFKKDDRYPVVMASFGRTYSSLIK